MLGMVEVFLSRIIPEKCGYYADDLFHVFITENKKATHVTAFVLCFHENFDTFLHYFIYLAM